MATLRPTAPSSHRPTVAKRGLTLVELLVVIVLLLILTAVAIPVLAPNVEQRRIREAARLVSTFLTGARSRAIEIGRPVGVQFERLAGNPNASMVLTYVEVPASYSGETLNATCTMFFDSASSPPGALRARMPTATSSFTLLKVNDLFKVNYQGYSYVVRSIDTTKNELTVDAIAPAGNPPLPWPTADGNDSAAVDALPDFPYQVIRQPVKASDTPLQLPEGAVVDISVSGLSSNPAYFNAGGIATEPLILVFYPGGVMGGIYYDGQIVPGTSRNVHLLIGQSDGVMPHQITTANKIENVSFDNSKVIWNLRNLNNIWVSTNAQTGMIASTENANIVSAAYPLDFGDTTSFDFAIRDARAIAKTSQSMGGR